MTTKKIKLSLQKQNNKQIKTNIKNNIELTVEPELITKINDNSDF